MRIAAALLADAAVARDGTLTVVNAGVNLFQLPELPSMLHASLAVMVEVEPDQREQDFTVLVDFYIGSGDTGKRLSGVRAEWEAGTSLVLFDDLPSFLPLGIDLANLIITDEGLHTIRVSLSGAESVYVSFRAMLGSDQSE